MVFNKTDIDYGMGDMDKIRLFHHNKTSYTGKQILNKFGNSDLGPEISK